MSDKIAPWEQSTCRVPMFFGWGGPAGHCDKQAFGPQLPEKFYNYNWNRRDGWTGRLIDPWAYCYGHACPAHHGPKEGDPIIFQDGTGKDGKPMYCVVMPGFVNLQESRAEFDQDPRKAVKRLIATKD
jgi:hypothetical protein